MFIFFVNKPITIIPYLLGLALCIYSCTLGFDPSVTVFVDIFNFSLWYTAFLIKYYVLSGQEEVVLWKVNINKFKWVFNCYLILNVIVVAWAHIRIIYYRGDSFSYGFLLAFYTGISFIIFQKILFAKFISEGIKHNSSIRNISFDEVYKEVREIAVNKLIKSNLEF